MFSLSLEFLRTEKSTSSSISVASQAIEGNKLSLPLERTALEQMNYTKWYYSGDSKKLISRVKDSYLNSPNTGLLHLNQQENSFVIDKPINISTDEFYYLFDYIKEKTIERGFELKDSVQEAISNNTHFVEFEIFYLFNSSTQQYITIEVRSYKGVPMSISGNCSYADNTIQPVKDTRFFNCIKEIFEIPVQKIAS